jgi:hypothetical protein
LCVNGVFICSFPSNAYSWEPFPFHLDLREVSITFHLDLREVSITFHL